jgi:Patatin-like phospholipase
MSLWTAEKRMLALDGGGVRGIVSIAFLERIEELLKERSGRGDDFRLSDHFDLIGGTSTGAIIAAGIATGRTMAEVKSLYEELAPQVFHRSWWRIPHLAARFAARPLLRLLEEKLGDITLEDPAIKTRLAIIMKRVDTGSPWIVSNLPDQPYWKDREDGRRLGNRHFKLASVVRASTAAPSYFGPEPIALSDEVTGDFIDGGVTPYNSPVLPLLILATMRRYGLTWPLGPERLSLISIGTGSYRRRTSTAWKLAWKYGGWAPAWVPALAFAVSKPASLFAADTLLGLIEDSQEASLMLMQWLSEPESPWRLNSDILDLKGDLLVDQPLLSFQRYDILLEEAWLKEHCGKQLTEAEVKQLRRLDSPAAMSSLHSLATEAAKRQVR